MMVLEFASREEGILERKTAKLEKEGTRFSSFTILLLAVHVSIMPSLLLYPSSSSFPWQKPNPIAISPHSISFVRTP